MSDCSPGCRVNFNLFYLREKYGQIVVTRVNRLANIKVRIAKYRCHLYFNHRCKENYVLPSSLRYDITAHLVIYLANTLSSYLGFLWKLFPLRRSMVCVCKFIAKKSKKKGRNRMVPDSGTIFFFLMLMIKHLTGHVFTLTVSIGF